MFLPPSSEPVARHSPSHLVAQSLHCVCGRPDASLRELAELFKNVNTQGGQVRMMI